jgi:uncharacterized membrane protein HdeD (DUF308 family)
MLEKRMKKRNFRLLVYVFGILIEFLGFALFFAPETTINFLSKYFLLMGVFLIFSGYVLAIAMRFKN